MSIFQLVTDYKPSGDQEQAIGKLLKSLAAGNRHQCLLGVTGSGKTFTMANIIAAQDRPVLVLSHNKTLAAQLYSELKSFFPHNAVEYFVSYFDYYQPEAYIASTDTYIEKDSAINEEIDRLCLNAMRSLLLRRDVIVVASVSCIYGLGSPEDYRELTLSVRVGQEMDRDAMLACLTELLFALSDYDFRRGTFRVRGDVVEIYPAQSDGEAIRVEFFGDEIDAISLIDAVHIHNFLVIVYQETVYMVTTTVTRQIHPTHFPITQWAFLIDEIIQFHICTQHHLTFRINKVCRAS